MMVIQKGKLATNEDYDDDDDDDEDEQNHEYEYESARLCQSTWFFQSMHASWTPWRLDNKSK